MACVHGSGGLRELTQCRSAIDRNWSEDTNRLMMFLDQRTRTITCWAVWDEYAYPHTCAYGNEKCFVVRFLFRNAVHHSFIHNKPIPSTSPLGLEDEAQHISAVLKNHVSMIPSIVFCLSEVGGQRQQVQQGNPDIPPQLLLEDPEAFPGQMDI